MFILRLSLKVARCGTQSTVLEGKHSLDVPTQAHQASFAFDTLESSQQALPVAHYRFYDAKYRIRCLFTQLASPGVVYEGVF